MSIRIDADAVSELADLSTAAYQEKASLPGALGSFNRTMAALVKPLNMHLASEINSGISKDDAMMGFGAALGALIFDVAVASGGGRDELSLVMFSLNNSLKRALTEPETVSSLGESVPVESVQ